MISKSMIIAIFGFAAAVVAQVPIAPIAPSPYPPTGPYNPLVRGPFVPILQQHYDLNPDGSYSYGFASADGTSKKEDAQVKYPGAPVAPGYPPQGGDLTVQGSYVYISPEGANIEVSYVADDFGYQPAGPNVHPAIQKAVAYQVAKAKAEHGQGIVGPVPGYNGAPFPAPTPFPAYPYQTPFPAVARPVRSLKKD